MFDANAYHVPHGVRFFVLVEGTNRRLMDVGIHRGDVLLVTHISNDTDNPKPEKLKSHLFKSVDGAAIDYTEPKEMPFGWLKYIGRPDGTGYINDAHEAKALAFLGGMWE